MADRFGLQPFHRRREGLVRHLVDVVVLVA